MNCKICNSETEIISTQKILQKHSVNYHQCSNCKFIQTDEPFWLEEAYQNIITSLDIGLISRNLYLQKEIPLIIDTVFPQAKIMLDYGGGYGMLVRMLRDLGYNFFRQDLYCENLFAKHFDYSDSQVRKFDILTAFEVFEHLANPLMEIEKMFELSENIIFSTVLIPNPSTGFENWWYVAPETGQHIAFYSIDSLNFIARKFNSHFYTNGNNLHMFSKLKIGNKQIKRVFKSHKSIFELIFPEKRTRTSLLQLDYNSILGNLKQKD